MYRTLTILLWGLIAPARVARRHSSRTFNPHLSPPPKREVYGDHDNACEIRRPSSGSQRSDGLAVARLTIGNVCLPAPSLQAVRLLPANTSPSQRATGTAACGTLSTCSDPSAMAAVGPEAELRWPLFAWNYGFTVHDTAHPYKRLPRAIACGKIRCLRRCARTWRRQNGWPCWPSTPPKAGPESMQRGDNRAGVSPLRPGGEQCFTLSRTIRLRPRCDADRRLSVLCHATSQKTSPP